MDSTILPHAILEFLMGWFCFDNSKFIAKENVKNEEGRFFEDYCNWQRISEFKKFAEESPAAQIVGEATGSKSIQLFNSNDMVLNGLSFFKKSLNLWSIYH